MQVYADFFQTKTFKLYNIVLPHNEWMLTKNRWRFVIAAVTTNIYLTPVLGMIPYRREILTTLMKIEKKILYPLCDTFNTPQTL